MSLLDSLEAYWKCDESSGNRVDSHTNGLDFIQTGFVGSAAGKLGLAVDGSGAAANSLDQPSVANLLFGDEAMAISCWGNVNAGEQSTNGPIVAVWDATGDQRCYRLGYAGALQRWRFIVSRDGAGGGSGTFVLSAAAPPFDGTFQHIVAQHNPITDVITIQVNDGAVQSAAHTGGLFAGSTARPGLGILNQLGTPVVHIQHADEIGIWRKNLTPTEVTQLFNSNNALSFDAFTSAAIALLSTRVTDRYSAQYLIELTNPQNPNATSIDNAVLNNAFNDVAALFRVYAGVTYDDDNPQHIAMSVAGIIAFLLLRTGQSRAADQMEAWTSSMRALSRVEGRNRIVPDSNTLMRPSADGRLTATPRPVSDDRHFDSVLPSSP